VLLVGVQGNPHEDALFRELFHRRRYNPLTRPVLDLSETVYLQFSLVLQKIVQLVNKSRNSSDCIQYGRN